MSTEPARWIRRFDNYKRVFSQLENAIELAGERELSAIEKDGVIQRFKYTFGLAWKVIEDFYKHQGETTIQGSKDAFRMAFKRGLITQGDVLMGSIQSRNDTVHGYDGEIAENIFRAVVEKYYAAFREIKTAFDAQLTQCQSR